MGAQLLLGCAFNPSTAERLAAADELKARDVVQRGYRPATAPEAIASTQLNVLVEGANWPVTIVRPTSSGPHPLVLYLPGLGESEEAGSLWRQAWARAGYAVLSVQALAEDESAWRSDLARGAEFRALAEQRYGTDALRQRLARLGQIWQACRQAASTGQAPWAGFDFSSVAVAGFDLGAQTAVALGSDAVPAAGQAWQDLAASVRGVLAFSPIEEGALPASSSVRAGPPILSLSAADDVDPTAWFSPPARRQDVFERWALSGSALLLFHEAGHGVLAGNPRVAVMPERRDAEQAAAAQPRRGVGRTRSGLGPGGPDAIDPVPKVQDASHLPVAERHGHQEIEAALGVVSLAWLDAQLRQREAARCWLQVQLPVWLGELGSWRMWPSRTPAC
ncbi:MAG: hypothetical protein JO370_09745 [Paucibacter sp.]|nr:hypothetical protein [Roseateles sp.]